MPNNNPYNQCLLLTYHEQVLELVFQVMCIPVFVLSSVTHLSLAVVDLSMLEPGTVLTNQFQHSVVPISLSACWLFSKFCHLYPYVDVVYWQPISQGSGGGQCRLSSNLPYANSQCQSRRQYPCTEKKVLSIEIIISVPQISKDASTSLFLSVFKVIRSENDLFPYI